VSKTLSFLSLSISFLILGEIGDLQQLKGKEVNIPHIVSPVISTYICLAACMKIFSSLCVQDKKQ